MKGTSVVQTNLKDTDDFMIVIPHHFVVKYYNSVSTRVLCMVENSEPIVYLRSIWWYHSKKYHLDTAVEAETVRTHDVYVH